MGGKGSPKEWIEDPGLIERARILLVLHLSKQPPGELVRIIMDWLEDGDLRDFCRRVLDSSDWERLERSE